MLASKVLVVLDTLDTHIVGACIHRKGGAPVAIQILPLIAYGETGHIKTKVVTHSKGNAASVIGRGFVRNGHVTACNGGLNLPMGIQSNI